MVNLKSALGADELTDKKAALPRGLLAEFLGTLLLNFFGCGAVVTENVVAIGLAFGLVVASAIQGIGHVSGGHVNPAVTCGLVIIGKVKWYTQGWYIYMLCPCFDMKKPVIKKSNKYQVCVQNNAFVMLFISIL